jgi:hypothetical protein
MDKEKFLKRLTNVSYILEKDLNDPLIFSKPEEKGLLMGCLITVEKLKKQVEEGLFDKEV